MRMIDGDTKITALLYNDEHEETERVEMSIADFLDGHTEEGCPQAVGGWISVKDRLPEKYIDVLVLVQYPKVNGYTGHYVVIAWKSTDDDSWDSDNNNFNNDPEGVVTHWMPLPEKPKEENDDRT